MQTNGIQFHPNTFVDAVRTRTTVANKTKTHKVTLSLRQKKNAAVTAAAAAAAATADNATATGDGDNAASSTSDSSTAAAANSPPVPLAHWDPNDTDNAALSVVDEVFDEVVFAVQANQVGSITLASVNQSSFAFAPKDSLLYSFLQSL
jgi:hypothetical protein